MTRGVYIAMGANLGDRRATIDAAVRDLNAVEGVGVVRVSSLVETAPVGPGSQGMYLNGAAELATTLSARALLDALLGIERSHGRDRDREARWGSRTLDLDLLVFGDAVIDEERLSVPHPRLHERVFVLAPLNEIAPDLSVPGRGVVRELFAAVVTGDDQPASARG